MTLLSAFKILLHKYTGMGDICVGTTIANRTREEIEGLIGFFVNTLALRSEVNAELSFNDFLQSVKVTTLEAYENQDLPFEKVVEIVEQERNPAYSPLFQAMMVLQNTPVRKLKLSGLSIEPVELESQSSKFDLVFELNETVEGISGQVEYNTDLFNWDRMKRMIKHFKILLRSIISDPTAKISDLEILTPREKHQLLVDWNNTDVNYPKEKCIHHLFEEQVEKTPDKVAIVFEDKELTYFQLNERANQLAHYLQKKGVKPESLVGICVERSLEMLVGLLGILKAGGAYVPIDPTYPKERKAFMFKDAACEVVLAQRQLELPSINAEVFYLDSDWNMVENESTGNVKSEVRSTNLVYVIYTSGSTGNPKGVMNQHDGVVNRLYWAQEIYSLKKSDIILQKTTYSFVLQSVFCIVIILFKALN